MKRLTFLFFFISTGIFAQTGIGTTTPNASAKLDVFSTNKGFLPPRVTLTTATDITTIASPAEGLMVYNVGSVGLQAGYYYWNGANWATIATATSTGSGVAASNMVNLYAKAYSTAAGDIANTNGYSFTVSVSGRYLFDFSCTGYSNATITYKVRQGTTDIGTDAQTSYNNTVHVEYNGKIEVNLQTGVTYNVYVNSTGNRDLGDYDRVYYKLVAGNLPVNQHLASANIQLNNNYLSNDGGNEGIRIDNSGNVGITNVSPADRLVVGSAFSLHDGGNKVIGLGWSPGSGNTLIAGYPAEIRLDQASGKLFFGTDPTLRTISSAAGVQRRMTITPQGNIGIGLENPSSKLHVSGADNITMYIQSSTSDNNGMLILNATTNQNWSSGWHEFMLFQNQGTTVGYIGAAPGGSGVVYSTTSDYRLKTDLKDYSGLDLISKINTYDYKWKNDNSRMFGVMAHELQLILPYAVSGQKDAVDADGKIIPQGVDYGKLTPILVKAIQEQESKIQTLEQRILKLEKLIQKKRK